MAGSIFPNINPSTTSGSALAALLNDFKDLVASGATGTSRPANLQAGGAWVDTTNAGSPNFYWEVKIYTGTTDAVVYRVNLSTNTASIPGADSSFVVEKISADAVGPFLKFLKERIANSGQTLDGDSIGEIRFEAAASDNSNPMVARIKVAATENTTSTNQGSAVTFEAIVEGTSSLVEMMRLIDGKLGINTQTPSAGVHVVNQNGEILEQVSDNTTGASLVLAKSRIASSGQVLSGDDLALIGIKSKDNAGSTLTGAEIEVLATENHTSTAHGTAMKMKVKGTGTTTLVEAVEITGAQTDVKNTLKSAAQVLDAQSVASAATIAALSTSKNIVHITGTTATELQGVDATGQSKVLVIHNNSTQTITVKHENASATATNRISLPYNTDLLIPANHSIELFYDTVASRWKTKSLQLPKEQAIFNANKIQGTNVSATAPTTNQVLKYDGSQWIPGTGGSGGSGVGGINYIDNFDAEVDTTGWALYKDADQAIPVDGTGGTATLVQFARSTTTPLRDVASFVYSYLGTTSGRGEGASYDFTIDRADQSKVLTISFDYIISSGTYADDGVAIYIYDVTNATIIQPTNYLIKNALIATKHSATFQTANNSLSYRLIFHRASTATTAFDLKLDNVTVGPQITANSAIVTEWVSYTPTGSWTNNTTYSGRWRRVGDHLEYAIRVAIAGGAPNATTLTIQHLPSGLAVDTSKILGTNTNGGIQVGLASMQAASSVFSGYAYYNGSNIAVVANNVASTYGFPTNVSATVPAAFNSGDYVEVRGSTPISGWSSGATFTTNQDGRLVTLALIGNPNSTISSTNSDITWSTSPVLVDTVNGFTFSTGSYVVQTPGYYRAHGVVEINRTGGNVAERGTWSIRNVTKATSRNCGSAAWYGTGNDRISITGSGLIYADAGDTLRFQANATGSGLSWINVATGTLLNIELVSAFPSGIVLNERVAARYTDTSGQSLGNGPAIIAFATKDYDTHNMVSSSIATIPVPGYYRIRGLFRGVVNNLSTATMRLYAYKNSTTSYLLGEPIPSAAGNQNHTVEGSTVIWLNATDTIALRLQTTFASNIVGSTTAQENSFEIIKVG